MQLLRDIEAGKGVMSDLDKLNDIADNINGKSFCALGDGAASPIFSSLKYFREEYEQHITGRGCPFDPAKSTAWADKPHGGERMTVTTSAPSGGGEAAVPPEDLVSLTIDGVEISVPKGTLVIRAAEQLGIEIPRFCDHPLLDPAGACRQCIVEVEGQRKPMASCTITCTDGMVVKTQLTSPVAEKAQRGVMELLLINHPLDCPVCDKGGECPLQNQAMSHGSADSRFEGKKRTYEKPVPISTQVLLDRERCVLCARCTRFSNQIAGDPMIELLERGALQQVGTGEGDPFESYFSGNTIQICPVGALTSAAYRFRSRPFDLVSSPQRVRALRRRLRAPAPTTGAARSCGGWPPTTPRSTRSGSATRAASAFRYAQQPRPAHHPAGAQRRRRPGARVLARGAGGRGRAGSPAARGRAGVLTGGRLTVEDAYAYAKFARVALDTNDIDFRARVHSAEEADFLAARGRRTRPGPRRQRASRTPRWRRRPAVLLVGFESEEEAPGVFLRLRKAHRKHGQQDLLARHARHPRPGEGGRHAAARRPRHRDRVAGRARRADVGLEGDGARAAEALRAEPAR